MFRYGMQETPYVTKQSLKHTLHFGALHLLPSIIKQRALPETRK